MARAARASDFKDEHQKAICTAFYRLSNTHSRHTLWRDFITMVACSFGQIDPAKREERAKMYRDAAEGYTVQEFEAMCGMLAEITMGLDANPDQDFLGDLFMKLELFNEYAGQFFTPYNVCKMMGQMTIGDLKAEVNERGYVEVNDPACGAGAQLIAAANEALRQDVNYQQSLLFVAQDIDFTAAMMCYIQLSLLGCPGYVIVGNTLTTPPTEPLSNQNVWYTPMLFSEIWQTRALIKRIASITVAPTQEPSAIAPADKTEQLTFY